ncbi:succinate dehydrogenase cytochrome b556 subunit [Vibrio sp. SS-MA-C1-2]|uniref:succinate dehydrogenase cytochrome b556 subunit n=1 Tax=Vibrio sp. SS-MA-C1-2 TaxID=2908646 RepID=UPI0038FCA9D3
MKKNRPVNLDLQTVRFPITAIASILHRVSGVIVFISIAILLWLLNLSLSSAEGFSRAEDIMSGFFVKLIIWGIVSALIYHLVVGIRHLCMDMGYFEELESGAKSAKVSFIISVVLILIAGVWIW